MPLLTFSLAFGLSGKLDGSSGKKSALTAGYKVNGKFYGAKYSYFWLSAFVICGFHTTHDTDRLPGKSGATHVRLTPP